MYVIIHLLDCSMGLHMVLIGQHISTLIAFTCKLQHGLWYTNKLVKYIRINLIEPDRNSLNNFACLYHCRKVEVMFWLPSEYTYDPI